MKETKIQFSPAETELMCNTEIILTKNKALGKIRHLLENLQMEMKAHGQTISSFSYPNPFLIDAKISKGENYLGLPYLVLDYPRNFSQENTFAIRTMFWWGNFFSTTLHLSGHYKTAYAPRLESLFNLFAEKGFYAGINDDLWVHHFERNNYIKLEEMGKENFFKHIRSRAHLKMATKISLQNWPALPVGLFESWKVLVDGCLY